MTTVTAKDGAQFDPDSMPLELCWNAEGTTVLWQQVVHKGTPYRQTFNYDENGNLLGVSRWVRV